MSDLKQINEDLLNKYNPLPPDRPSDGLVNLETDPATGRTRVAGPQPEILAGRTPSLVERLLGTMPSTGFFIPQNDYTGVSGTITRKGAHIAVANELEKIKFVAGTFGGMQNRVAIIRYWCKGDKCTQKATVASEAVVAPTGASVPEKVAEETSQLFSFNPFALAPEIVQIASGREVFDLAKPEEPAPPGTLPAPKLGDIPSTQQIPRALPVDQTPAPAQQPAPPPLNTGPVLSATPGARSTTVTSPTEAAWQFLFNPEELQLESGPEFNRAETWGVSDLPGSGAANSGQPLAWRFNKNRKLIFGKVLLTGYVLGRRVDSLEKGLQQLFMARSGPGMDGPPVLEFVWGSRVFGPCVIQNLRVRERAWDDGHLVNAEVSFDLEQVPEWTINDGAVDIARPGRQSLVNDPFLPRAEPEQPGTGAGASTTPPPQNQPGGGGGQSQQKALTAANCSALKSDLNAWNGLTERINKNKEGEDRFVPPVIPPFPGFPLPIPIPGGGRTVADTFPGNLEVYKSLQGKIVSNSFYRDKINSTSIPTSCLNTQLLTDQWNRSKKGTREEKKAANSAVNTQLLGCTNALKSVVTGVVNSSPVVTACGKLETENPIRTPTSILGNFQGRSAGQN